MRDDEKKRGPDPDTLKIEGDWKDAVRGALKKEAPPEGWPEREVKPRKKRKRKKGRS